MSSESWPALPYEEWAPTKKTLQMCAQMLGKTRLALAPPQPEWLHSCLYLDSRGFTTGAMPYGVKVLSAGIGSLPRRSGAFPDALGDCGSHERIYAYAVACGGLGHTHVQ